MKELCLSLRPTPQKKLQAEVHEIKHKGCQHLDILGHSSLHGKKSFNCCLCISYDILQFDEFLSSFYNMECPLELYSATSALRLVFIAR